MFSKEEILRDLDTKRIGRKLFVFDSLDSTNVCARTLAEAGSEEGTLVVADFQTDGKGRLGRRWHASPGTSLLFSVVLRPPLKHESAGLLAFFSAVAVARAVERETSMPVECKWPNDLLLKGRKVCGILLESSMDRERLAYCIAGVGLNVGQQSLHPDIAARATSIRRETGKDVDRAKLLLGILREMDFLYQDVAAHRFERVLDEWHSRCTMFGKKISILQHDHRVDGSAVGLSAEGGLILKTAQGTQTVFAGDVTLLSS